MKQAAYFAGCEFLTRVWNPLIKNSYSGVQEDLIIDELMGHPAYGTYLDIGCMSPRIGSNTYRFYRKGWAGICVDANRKCIEEFMKVRPRDASWHCGVGACDAEMEFFHFFPCSLSTFDPDRRDEILGEGFELVSTEGIKITTIKNLLGMFPQVVSDDTNCFFSVDTEGYDFGVLVGNDWNRFRPKVVCVEEDSELVYEFMVDRGYKLARRTFMDSFYVRIGPGVAETVTHLRLDGMKMNVEKAKRVSDLDAAVDTANRD